MTNHPGRLAVAAAPAILLTPGAAAAHGFGERYDLPVPLSLWLAGAAAAVLLSFAIVGLMGRRRPGDGGYPRLDFLRFWLGRAIAARRVRVALERAGVAVLLLVVVAGAVGQPELQPESRTDARAPRGASTRCWG